MSKKKRYKFNPETLSYELYKRSLKMQFSKGFYIFITSLIISIGYYYLWTVSFDSRTPKLIMLEQEAQHLNNKIEMLNSKFNDADKALAVLQMRDNYIYRPIFGMEEIPTAIRNAGIGGVDRYDHLKIYDNGGRIAKLSSRVDHLYKKAFVQSHSFDDVSAYAKNANDMTIRIPAIPPLNLASSKIHISSWFGYRSDPFVGRSALHTGIDFACPIGEPVYVTGKGKVVEVGFDFFGYGSYVIVDHGFGYKTRYAHLKTALVTMGTMVNRGDKIALSGNTGRSTGPHLHYEVIYKNQPINPENYYSMEISAEDYFAMVSPAK